MRQSNFLVIALGAVVAFTMLPLAASAEFDTEIVSLDLVGADPFFGNGLIHVGVEGAGNPSIGQVQSAAGGLSFFDVYPKITIDDCGSGSVELTLDASEDPVHLEANIASLPPANAEEYIDAAAVTKLLNSNNPACVLLGLALEIKHSLPPGGPDSVIDHGGGVLEYTYEFTQAQIQIELDGGGLVPLAVSGPVTILSQPSRSP